MTVCKSPGESFNFFYKKLDAITNLITSQNNNMKYTNNTSIYITESQVKTIYNKAVKEVASSLLGCKYY